MLVFTVIFYNLLYEHSKTGFAQDDIIRGSPAKLVSNVQKE